MSGIACLSTLLFDTNTFNTIIVIFCFLETAVLWISSGLFIRKFFVFPDTVAVRESNPIYFWSIICCTLLLSLMAPTITIDQVLWVHYYYPYPHINYDSNACKNNNLLTLFEAVNIPFAVISGPAYCGLICIYFQRLIIIFQNTVFQVSGKVKKYFMLYIVISFISYIFMALGEVAGTSDDRWSFLNIAQIIGTLAYLLAYITESFYICYLLRGQLFSMLRLLEKMASNANNPYINNRRNLNLPSTRIELKNINGNGETAKVQSLTPSITTTSINVKTDSHESDDDHDSDRNSGDGNENDIGGVGHKQSNSANNPTMEIREERSVGDADRGRGVRSVGSSASRCKGVDRDRNELFKKLKRLTILTYSPLLSTLINVIVIMLVGFIIENVRTGNMVLLIFVVSDISINFACLSLQFSFTDNIYNVLCRRCDNCQTFSKVEHALTVNIGDNYNVKKNNNST